MKKSPIISMATVVAVVASACSAPMTVAAPLQSLVPNTPNTSPDYFCTWNIQGFYSSYASGDKQKEAIRESRLFGKGTNENWLGQFAKVKGDLYFVMDEGWDLPEQQVMVVPDRFPSFAAENQAEGFKKLSDAVKQSGWRGLGLWMRADAKTEDFWNTRLRWMKASGVDYWKVDYGHDDRNEAWRRGLTERGRKLAPGLIIETAMVPHSITWGDSYRTYDVDALLSVPQTLKRVADLLQFKAERPAKGLINCEDEVYLGAALGCAYGVMRHGQVGNLPSGRQDFVFPPLTRDLKQCIDEVTRAVRWHRIAPAFAVGTNEAAISAEKLTDNWQFQKDESWHIGAGQNVSESAPATVTRGIPMPEVTLPSGKVKPFVVASRHPNGAVAVATLGRTLCPSPGVRQWSSGEVADVTLQVGRNSGPTGVFGRYHSLTLNFDKPLTGNHVFAQDLAGEVPQDITSLVRISGNRVAIPGSVIDRIGRSAATPGDKSDPGLALVIRKK